MKSREWKQKARELIQTSRPPIMLVALILAAVGWVFSLLEQRIGATPFYIDLGAVESMDTEHMFGVDYSHVTTFALVLALAFQMMSSIMDFGFVRHCLNVHRGAPAGISDLFSGFEYPGKVIGLWLLQGVLTGLLTMLFIVPGVIAGYAWSMSRRLLCDHPDWSPARCLRESRTLMHGRKGELFMLHLSFFGWFLLLGLIPAATVFVHPYVGLTESGFYRDLVGDSAPWTPEAPTDNELPPPGE